MKLSDRTKIPLRPVEKSIPDIDKIPYMGDDDLPEVMKFIKAKDDKGLKEFINNKMKDYEEAYSDQAGLPTRDYLNSLLGAAVLSQDPELELESTHAQYDPKRTIELAKKLKDKVYPGLTNNVTAEYEGSQYQKARNGKPDRLNIDPSQSRFAKIGHILHEYGHNLDRFQKNEDEEGKSKLLKLKPEYSKVLNSDEVQSTTHSEAGYKNPRIPNFEDYNFESGDFNSDWMRDPTDVQDEQAREHHINRNYPMDNLKNFINGGLDKVVDTDKLNKLKKLMS